MKLNRAGWIIVLWLAGFLTMAIIAGFFRLLLQLAY